MNRPQYQQTPTSGSTWTYGSGASKNYGCTSPTTALTGGLDIQRLPSLIGTLMFIVPLAAWLWWIFVHESTTIDRQKLQLYSTANATRLLLMSSVSVTLSKLVVGPLMAIHAYTAAIDWLDSSTSVNQMKRLPTPVHLGTISSIYSGARLIDIISAIRVRARSPKYLKWPRMLTRAIWLLTWLVVLSAAVTGVDLWLHFDASPTSDVPTSTNFAAMGYDPNIMLFSRSINDSWCATENQRTTAIGAGSCGLSDGSATTVAANSGMAKRILTNSSTIHQVVWLDDNTAVLAPRALPRVGYAARAIGIKASCHSITPECVQCDRYDANVALTCRGPEVGPTIDCRGPTPLNATAIGEGWNFIDRKNGSTKYRDFAENPLALGNVVKSGAYVLEQNLGNAYFVGDTGFLRKSRSAANVLFCDLGVYDVLYQYIPPSQFTLLSKALAANQVAGYTGHSLQNWVEPLYAADGTGLSGPDKFVDVYGRELNKVAITLLARAIGQTPVVRLLPGRTDGTRVTLIGILLSLVLDALIVFTVLVVGVQSGAAVFLSNSKFFATARGRLLSTYPLLGDSLGGLDFDFNGHKHAVSACLDEKSFKHETEDDRLVLRAEQVDGQGGQQTVRLRPRRV